MAILNVPEIDGPSYGGVIYGLSLQMGYSSEPSKLTLDIVNPNGVYLTPSLNTSATISFQNFIFHGLVYSYEIKETSEERVLQVVLIDQSIILDRYSVVLWRRGFFKKPGEIFQQVKTFDFSDESIFVLIPRNTDILIEKRTLGKVDISRPRRYFRDLIGNIICIGTEKYPNSICDISDSDYSFQELNGVIKKILPSVNFNPPLNYRNTHEGTLREVLQNWATDCGVEFYWDFSQNKISTYPNKNGIVIETAFKSSNLIEKSTSVSLEGTWVQSAFAYTTKTRTTADIEDQSTSISFARRIFAIPISWYLRRNGTIKNYGLYTNPETSDNDAVAKEKNLWGGRTCDEFLKAAFLGYISPALRDIYVSLPPPPDGDVTLIPWWALGVSRTKTSETTSLSSIYLTVDERNEVIKHLELNAKDDYNELSKLDTPNLSNFNMFLGTSNDGNNDLWKATEKEILGSYGKTYRHSLRGGTYFTCTPSFVIKTDITVAPASASYEGDNQDFQGMRILERNGPFSHSDVQAQLALSLNEDSSTEALDKIKIRTYSLESGGLKKLFPETTGTLLYLVPTAALVNKHLKNFSVSLGRGPNPEEATITKISAAKASNSTGSEAFNCESFDQRVKDSECPDAKTEAYEQAIEAVTPTEEGSNSTIDGLVSAIARSARIDILGKSLTIHAPSDMPYEVVVTLNTSIKYIKSSPAELEENIYFDTDGDTSLANDVAYLTVLSDNVTDPLEDDFGERRKNPMPKAQSLSNTSPSTISRYVFAGFPPTDLSLVPSKGLTSVDISYSSEGFKTTVVFSSKPPKTTNVDMFKRRLESQFNRAAFNGT